MKKILLISSIILSGCSQNIGNLSIVSTRPTNISNEYKSIGLIRGEKTIFVSSADKMPRINDPIQNALNISGADLITNASFELEFYLFFKIIKVTGEGWVKKTEGNTIETQTQKKIIEYDPATGEPIYE
ncbi:MAG: hypothetical protein HN815_04750 [Candidatus Marinimicrobia bacterium]|jgi:hypothetical protein|nr:hypothetical protein [Candidatus Neomarinimicrobiota bacterium]MBT4054800.1 hypothetical protein [Candidatus Neomarinimicrobiota bacterium]MBT4369114.1 hypothetical protein [Candidatus Neomarinimicrobiota bacterium]MBT5224671.1 hypothetical protein [Candidatus Neomarinimicrobiota bacterium]MBT7373281.1 hypothetical protein [Candidatus Neomarinimicrobiota bacterium]